MPSSRRAKIRQLDVGDDHAEQVDLHHRPGPQQLGEPEHLGHPPGNAAEPERQQDVGRAQQPGQRHHGRGQQHQHGERPHALLVQAPDAGKERARVGIAFEFEGQEREGVGDHEQDQRGERQQQGVLDAVPPLPVQRRAAAAATGGATLGQRAHVLHRATLVTGDHAAREPGGASSFTCVSGAHALS